MFARGTRVFKNSLSIVAVPAVFPKSFLQTDWPLSVHLTSTVLRPFYNMPESQSQTSDKCPPGSVSENVSFFIELAIIPILRIYESGWKQVNYEQVGINDLSEIIY